MAKDFDLTITWDDLCRIAPQLLATVKGFVGYGLCRQANTWERKSLAEKFASLAQEALKQFPQLKLNHMNAKTTIVDAPPAPPIIVTVSGGVVQHVANVPPGVVVEVRDYDCMDGNEFDPKTMTRDEATGDYYESWRAEHEKPATA